jgi:hypothetical protein
LDEVEEGGSGGNSVHHDGNVAMEGGEYVPCLPERSTPYMGWDKYVLELGAKKARSKAKHYRSRVASVVLPLNTFN